MIATAIGPQNTLRVSGIIASTAAAAVLAMGRPVVIDALLLELSYTMLEAMAQRKHR